jgi:uncharacterized membrane protein (DUF2068 family)
MISISASTLVAIFSILIGIFMIGFWSYAVIADIVPAEEKPWAITFHIFSEFSTSILLIISGVGQWLNMDWAKYLSLLALGMLLYIVIYSPGYYIQKNNLPMGIMFIILILLTVTAIIALLR